MRKTMLPWDHHVLAAIPDGVAVVDPAQEGMPIVFVNAAFEKITGYSTQEAGGCIGRFLLGEDRRQPALVKLRRALREKKPCSALLQCHRKDGTLYWNRISIAPVRDQEGKWTHFVGLMRDVTREREMETQLRRAEKLEAIGKLAGRIAHDFNNIHAVILGYSELALRKLPKQHLVRPKIEAIQAASRKATQITRHLLAFSRNPLRPQRVMDLNAHLKQSVNVIQQLAGENVVVTMNLGDGPAPIWIDPEHLDQIITHLVRNARDAMPAGGTLTIEVKADEPGARRSRRRCWALTEAAVRLRVTDSGTGMTDEVKNRLFEPFFTTKKNGERAGLGLAMVYNMVHRNGGRIEVRTAPGKGACFTLIFPCATHLVEAVSSQPGYDKLRHRPGTILIVEDEPAVRKMAVEALGGNGYRILEASDGQEAFRIWKTKAPPVDLVFTDLVMPVMGGIELAERVCTSDPKAKILFTSGYSPNTTFGGKPLEPGVNFLAKPYDISTLIHKVQAMLAKIPHRP